MSEYIEQAENFLKETNTTLNIEFKEFNSMGWDEDGQKRNIFNCTLSNVKGVYTFPFGSSVVDSCKKETRLDLLDNQVISCRTEWRATLTNFSFDYSFSVNPNKVRLLDLIKDCKEKREIAIKDWLKNSKNRKKYNIKFKDESFFIKRLSSFNVGTSIESAIRKETKKLSETYTYKNQKDKIELPSSYDILSCLSVYYNEDFQEFCDCFGYDSDSIKALNTFKEVELQEKELQKIFCDEEIEMLNEIQ